MSDHISIRPINPSDADWIFRACQDPEIQKWTQIPRPYTHHHAVEFATTMAGDVEVWIIENRTTQESLGVIGIHSIDPITRVADIGYWMSREARGQGAMKAGLLALFATLQNNPNVALIEASIAEGNSASRKTAESVGFTLAGRAERSCNCGGEEVSAVLYQLALKPSQLRNLVQDQQ